MKGEAEGESDPDISDTSLSRPRRLRYHSFYPERPLEPFTMTTVQIELPEKLARKTREAGLLAPKSMERVLREALRREAFEDLLSVAERVEAAGISSMSMDEINAEIQAYRGK